MRLFMLLLFTSCSHLFYHPLKEEVFSPKQFNLTYQDIFFKVIKDNRYTYQGELTLHGYLIPHQDQKKKVRATLLHFHGNAENISTHFLSIAWMALKDFDVINFDYRGYGKSEGAPSQRGTYLDSLAALKYAYDYAEKNTDGKLIIFAQSLGGIIALRALHDFPARDKIKLVVLDSTFTSYQRIAAEKISSVWFLFPLFPLTDILVSDEFAAEKKLSTMPEIPYLVIHGKEDFIVPYHLGEELFKKLPPEKKQFWPINDGYHTDIFHRHDQKYRQKFLDYLKELQI